MKVWTSLTDIIARHRKFSTAQWALPSDKVDQIQLVANKLVPEDPSIRNRRLFSERDFDLYEGTADWDAQARLLDKRREEAISEIYRDKAIQKVLDFAASVETPFQVGVAFGGVSDPQVDPALLPSLVITQDKAMARFIEGFIVARFRVGSWEWVDKTLSVDWTSEQKGQFLAYLPFASDAWTRVANILGADASAYWTRTNAWPYHADDSLSEAIEELLRNERPLAAMRSLTRLVHEKKPIQTDQAIRALFGAPLSKEARGGIDGYDMVELIKQLQTSPETDSARLQEVEWLYLGILEGYNEFQPKTLERRLAEDPAFFCELIRGMYRSTKAEEPKEEPSAEQKFFAKRAFRLFHDWSLPPGSARDGAIDEAALNAWLEQVKSSTSASGHLEVAMITVGHVLAHSPPDPAGLWLHRAAATVLDAKDGEDLRSGFMTELYNQRGVHWVDPTGGEERKLAADYRKKADEIENAGLHRVATSLRQVADGYIREAERIAKETDNE